MSNELIELLTELNGRNIKPKLWLRDDDICTDSPNFRLLVRIAEYGFPMLFGAVPYRMKFSDAELLYIKSLPYNVFFCVHGYNHLNRSVNSQASEYPGRIKPDAVMRELSYGFNKVREFAGERFIPAFIPPWNYMHPSHLKVLKEIGYKIVSGSVDVDITKHGERNIHFMDSHIDILTYGSEPWHKLKDITQLNQEFVSVLKEKMKEESWEEPICILSHHTSMLSSDVELYSKWVSSLFPYFSKDVGFLN